MDRDALCRLCTDDLIALILAQADVIARQAAQIDVLTKRVEELEAKLGKPPKTPDNSSLPPRQGQRPIRPVVTRIHRHRGICPCCRRGFSAAVPDGMAPGSPFGPGVAALVLHLHVTQAISFERLVGLMEEVFGVRLSEGAIANMLARAEAPMVVAAEKIADAVRAAKVVASDETSARVGGKTWWQWVLLSSTAICHVIADTRAARVVTDFMRGAVP